MIKVSAKGIPASKGYALGVVVRKPETDLSRLARKAASPDEEKKRFHDAVELAKVQVRELAGKVKAKAGEESAAILESHLAFLSDPDILGGTEKAIEEGGLPAERAVLNVTDAMAEEFEGFDDDPYIKERAADIRDVGERIVNNLLGRTALDMASLPENTVLVAHDLKPSDTARIDTAKIAAFVTEIGGETGHTAILARQFGVPAVVGADGALDAVRDGDFVIVDGTEGLLFVNPDGDAVAAYTAKRDAWQAEQKALREMAGTPSIDKKGRKITLYANIGSEKDVEPALRNGAEGVGLFRTEFLFLGRQQMPTEEEQFSSYRAVAEGMGGRPVVVRTLDIGGDKDVPYLHLKPESNPFLGLRAIRLCLRRPEIFRTQLRAILRASAFGDLRIMFPMISSIAEFTAAKAAVEKCKRELLAEGVAFRKDIPVGMMIEIPSAALQADEFARLADFFSIGTNDLTQYTLAVDRLSESISSLYDARNPAVLRLIRETIEAAHRHGIECAMCGELAAQPDMFELLADYGLDEFSMSAGAILEVRKAVLKR